LHQFNFLPPHLTIKRAFTQFQISYPIFCEIFDEFTCKANYTLSDFLTVEKRLIEIYLIIKSNVKFIFLNEPFTFLSPLQIEKVKQILVQEKKQKGILITDHLIEHIFEISNYKYLLTNGAIFPIANFDDLKKYVYLNKYS
jgi:ABC-type lipopolysaccharide export system ATPase subunit